jgi:hypothetical protein
LQKAANSSLEGNATIEPSGHPDGEEVEELFEG